MEPVTTRVGDETLRHIRETADERDVSMAEVLRELIEKGLECDELERKAERLEREKSMLIADREERQELVEYVQEERELQSRREERRDAPDLDSCKMVGARSRSGRRRGVSGQSLLIQTRKIECINSFVGTHVGSSC